MNLLSSMRLLLVLLCTISISVLSTGCNVKGFFVKQSDDPYWVDPAPVETAGGATKDIGEVKYNQNCAACHGGNGKGLAGAIPPLAGSALANDADATKPIRIVLHGFKGEIERNGTKYNGVMQAWQDTFSNEEIAAILSFVRRSWGNTGAAITAEEVGLTRDKSKSQTTQYTEAQLQNPL